MYICEYRSRYTHGHTIFIPFCTLREVTTQRGYIFSSRSCWLRSLRICAPATMTSNTPKGQRWKSLLVASSPRWCLPYLICWLEHSKRNPPWGNDHGDDLRIGGCGIPEAGLGDWLKRCDFQCRTSLDPFGDGSNQFIPIYAMFWDEHLLLFFSVH